MTDRELVLQMGEELNCAVRIKNHDEERAALDEGITVRCDEDGNVAELHFYSYDKSVKYPEGIERLALLFWDCESLETIYIPESVAEVSIHIGYCPSLARLNVHQDNPNYSDIDGVLFSKDRTKLIYIPQGHTDAKAEHYAIPEGVTEIHYNALRDCFFTSVTIPESMNVIELKKCRHLERVTLHDGVTEILGFEGCESLETLHIPAGITKIMLSTGVFDGCGVMNRYCPVACGRMRLFSQCQYRPTKHLMP